MLRIDISKSVRSAQKVIMIKREEQQRYLTNEPGKYLAVQIQQRYLANEPGKYLAVQIQQRYLTNEPSKYLAV